MLLNQPVTEGDARHSLSTILHPDQLALSGPPLSVLFSSGCCSPEGSRARTVLSSPLFSTLSIHQYLQRNQHSSPYSLSCIPLSEILSANVGPSGPAPSLSPDGSTRNTRRRDQGRHIQSAQNSLSTRYCHWLVEVVQYRMLHHHVAVCMRGGFLLGQSPTPPAHCSCRPPLFPRLLTYLASCSPHLLSPWRSTCLARLL